MPTKPTEDAPAYRDILYETKDDVAWVTINRPRVLNAFREQTLDELTDALKSTREDPSIACAVVTGASSGIGQAEQGRGVKVRVWRGEILKVLCL